MSTVNIVLESTAEYEALRCAIIDRIDAIDSNIEALDPDDENGDDADNIAAYEEEKAVLQSILKQMDGEY